jgi:hypothetical protein
MTTNDPLEAQFTAEFIALAERTERISIEIRPLDAWILLCQLQLALRHPENSGPSADKARQIARRLQSLVAPTGALKIVAERGWDTYFDVPRKESEQ